jgi:hypothetical protein
MKLLTLVSSLLAVTYATELEAQDVQDVQAPSQNWAEAPQGEKILPRIANSQPKWGEKRTHVPYGTYSISSKAMTKKSSLFSGPCGPTACYVSTMEATIKYGKVTAAGFNAATEANVDTGSWLHHIALFGTGGGSGSLWAAGNERPTLRLAQGGKYGLELGSFMMIIDLMSENTTPKDVTLFITYDHVPKGTAGWKAAYMYWLTIGEPAAKAGVYKFTSTSSTSSVTGKLLYAIGHMHDGGTDMRLFVGSKMVCKSVMYYNAREGYGAVKGGAAASTATAAKGAAKGAKAGGDAHSHSKLKMKFKRQGHAHGGGDGAEHISDPGACVDFGTVSKGDRMYAEAWYDANKHPLMVHNGKKEALMGNMRVYIG